MKKAKPPAPVELSAARQRLPNGVVTYLQTTAHGSTPWREWAKGGMSIYNDGEPESRSVKFGINSKEWHTKAKLCALRDVIDAALETKPVKREK